MSDDKREMGPLEKAAEASLERTKAHTGRCLPSQSLTDALKTLDEIQAEYGLHHVSMKPSLERRVHFLEAQMNALMCWLSDHHTDGGGMTVFRSLLFDLEKAGGCALPIQESDECDD